MTYLRITPRDPVIARDGRPFNAGQRMKSLDWPYPSVLAGALRTMAGKKDPRGFTPEAARGLLKLESAGPLPLRGGELYFPAAKDLVARESDGRCFAARPSPQAKAWTDLPAGLSPVLLDESIEDDFKPAKLPAFWPCAQMTRWLLQDPAFVLLGRAGANIAEAEERTHVAIQPDRGAADDGMLFQTVGLRFADAVSMALRVDGDGVGALHNCDELHPVGGERRLAHWKIENSLEAAWRCPGEVRTALTRQPRQVRMVLATPALFGEGWRPRWLDESGCGSPEGMGLRLRLVGACVDRWRPVSGWDLKEEGTKATRRLAPAGSVYFFDVEEGDVAQLAGWWLKPVSDKPQDCLDGFGLAIWGIWSR